jgi:Beta-propeller repeat
LALDSAGNSYITGGFSGTATFGTNTFSSRGGIDAFISKVGPSGKFLWAVSAGGSAEDAGKDVAVDSAGNSYITGTYEDMATFGVTTHTSKGKEDVFVAKLSPSGKWLWAVAAGGSSEDRGRGIVVDSAGNSYITGTYEDTAVFGVTTHTSKGKEDVFVAKLSPSGKFLWVVSAGGNGSDVGRGIAVDGKNNIYVTGYLEGSAIFGSTTLTGTFFVAKLSPGGKPLWAVTSGMVFQRGFAVTADNAGNSYVTGDFEGEATYCSTALKSKGWCDVFVAKLDPSGKCLWAVSAGGSLPNDGYGIAVDNTGNSYVTGGTYGTATFGATALTSKGNEDVFVAKLGPNGKWLWAVSTGASDYDWGGGLAVDSSGNGYITGGVGSTATFGPTTITSKGKSDIFVWRIPGKL